jgi:hypothetical protein
LKTREEAIKLIESQLSWEHDKGERHRKPADFSDNISAWHYGKCELYDLLDFIYGADKE